jgi:alkylhydroperoxidase family enzyme
MRYALLATLLAAACATGRDASSAKRGLEETKRRASFLPMRPEKEARDAMPGFSGKRAPHLARVAAHMPKTFRAEMEAWNQLREEGALDRQLLSEVFYVVSSANDCFY